MIFKKKKTVLEEQPLCYWEESSYIRGINHFVCKL